MRVAIDHEKCLGNGLCVAHVDTVFELREGLAWLKVDPVPVSVEDLVRWAMEDCPTGAISPA